MLSYSKTTVAIPYPTKINIAYNYSLL